MKKIGIVNVIMILLSLFVLVCYLPYFVLIVINGESMLTFTAALSAIIAAIVPACLFLLAGNRLSKALRTLRAVYICGMAFYAVTFTLFSAYIASCASLDASEAVQTFKSEESEEKDVVLVFGCRTYGYTPGVHLKNRLDAAYILLENLPDAVCVVSGGQGQNETIPEAEAMRAYLEERGIDPSRIYMEEKSHNTYENIENSVELLENNNIEYGHIIGVSSEFHVPRIRYLFDYYGINGETVASRSPGALFYFTSVVREYMAYVKMFTVTAF